jgi:NAD(P)-dependent dehydrogenase (short-subunit alcohol dehydrogenase family)
MNGEVMKIFLAGASGAIGSQLVPQLAAGGHEVVGTTRSAAKTGALRVLGAKPPRRVPAWLVGLLTGKGPVNMMTRARGISNENTKRELDWTPQCPSWRTGFTEGLS